MSEIEENEPEEHQQQINHLQRWADHIETTALPPDRIFWLLATQYILGGTGLFGGIAVGLIWGLNGPTEAAATAELIIHLTLAILMVVGAITLIVKGQMKILSRL